MRWMSREGPYSNNVVFGKAAIEKLSGVASITATVGFNKELTGRSYVSRHLLCQTINITWQGKPLVLQRKTLISPDLRLYKYCGKRWCRCTRLVKSKPNDQKIAWNNDLGKSGIDSHVAKDLQEHECWLW